MLHQSEVGALPSRNFMAVALPLKARSVNFLKPEYGQDPHKVAVGFGALLNLCKSQTEHS